MSVFKFKFFTVNQTHSAMKIGTDAMVLGAFLNVENRRDALDIGTGTGVLSLMAAQKNPDLCIDAIELEEKAFSEAKSNFENSPFSSQLRIFHQDFLHVEPGKEYDCIFTNPPFFENALKSSAADRNWARHTDRLPFADLFSKVSKILAPGGDFWIILPHDVMTEAYVLATANKLFVKKEILIYGKPGQLIRKIAVFSSQKIPPVYETITIRQENNQYTGAYKALTIDYHFNRL